MSTFFSDCFRMKTKSFQKAEDFEQCTEALLLLYVKGVFRSTIRLCCEKIIKKGGLRDAVILYLII